jgi:hypothetical protein
MRTRVLLAVAALLFPLLALADALDRDILLTSGGTMYTIESVSADSVANLRTDSSTILTLSVQNGADAKTMPVPATLNGGWHISPALAYDSDSDTLFVFWEGLRNNGLASDLNFVSYHAGTWGSPNAIDTLDWNLRRNLRIAITRKVDDFDSFGNPTVVTETHVHAVWWEEKFGYREWARYAMLNIDKGNVTSKTIHDLSDFVTGHDLVLTDHDNVELLRHPVMIESPAHDTVDVVWGNVDTQKMHRTTISVGTRVGTQGFIRIPVGRSDRTLPTPSASTNSVATVDTSISAFSPAGDSIVFYFAVDQAMYYSLLKDGKWSSKSVALSGKINRDVATEAIRRMVGAQ